MATNRNRSRENEHSYRARDAENCPTLAGNAVQRAQYADADAADFAMLVRDEPPEVVWGRVARWAEENPERLMATFVHLAAMVDVDERLAPWTRRLGGTAALHPDYRSRPDTSTKRGGGPPSKYRTAVHDLVNTTQLSDHQIAERLGCSRKLVATYRCELGVHRPFGPKPEVTDAKVAALEAEGLSAVEIAAETGYALTTVKKSRRRLRDARAEPDSDASAA